MTYVNHYPVSLDLPPLSVLRSCWHAHGGQLHVRLQQFHLCIRPNGSRQDPHYAGADRQVQATHRSAAVLIALHLLHFVVTSDLLFFRVEMELSP